MKLDTASGRTQLEVRLKGLAFFSCANMEFCPKAEKPRTILESRSQDSKKPNTVWKRHLSSGTYAAQHGAF